MSKVEILFSMQCLSTKFKTVDLWKITGALPKQIDKELILRKQQTPGYDLNSTQRIEIALSAQQGQDEAGVLGSQGSIVKQWGPRHYSRCRWQ